ncbi:dienelactone hydrolase family protein [Gordonia sp. JH63]|uniref:dienelactone hydrolase family protein n=1 Tax=unclassified Gordonia (in: high G+C Gram-positive bacteria) TaxID=2657482 RepID=UPI0013200F7B|nr:MULTISPECIES: dienelactone hydrolase family protein [unclassified Gordonia (in: high G+C Gram-positive bacteria)]MCT1352083.1 dienelactone hydrolase family protein [Gordonia sp. p3-SID1431]QHD87649.1 dienelactone hydrolase family protein [Gordonia sp. JH63]
MTGETITISAADGETEAYVARPDSSGTSPGVLFFTDVIGLRPRIEAMADRIASWGYVVLVPHLFHRYGSAAEWAPTEDLLLPEARTAFFRSAMPRARTLTPDAVRPDLVAYLDALQSLPGVAPGRVGVTGYCMGGRLALNIAAARPDDVAAVGMFHTGGLVTDDHDSPHLHLVGIDAFVLAIHADKDSSLPAMAVAQFEHALTGGGVAHSATVYPGAPHGYTMSDLAAYHHEACEHHFDELMALFRRMLSG